MELIIAAKPIKRFGSINLQLKILPLKQQIDWPQSIVQSQEQMIKTLSLTHMHIDICRPFDQFNIKNVFTDQIQLKFYLQL